MANTSTRKQYPGFAQMPASKAQSPKSAEKGNSAPTKAGQIGPREAYAEPMTDGVAAKITGIQGLHNDIGEMSGFITEGYIDKNGIPYGEAAKFNFLPPGMDIMNQENIEVHDMPMRTLVAGSYPGDGWSPAPRDVQE